MANMFLTESEREEQKILNRMDRLDSIVAEYLRKYRTTTEKLCEKIGCSESSLWRYRKTPEGFQKAPLFIIGNILRLTNASNEQIRYILGLPTGMHYEN